MSIAYPPAIPSANAATRALRLLARLAIYPPLALRLLACSHSRAPLAERVRWLQSVAQAHLRWFGLRVRVIGEIPRRGLIVANHVSYLDIVALAAVGGFAFVSKKEVAHWPLFGTFAKRGGTIFIDRERRGAVAQASLEMRGHLDAGIPLVLFPEGTSTDGSHLLPFRTSLFEPVLALGSPLTACGLRYTCSDGSVAHDVAYWGEMKLAPQLYRLLQRAGTALEIHFGHTQTPSGDRKTLAREYEDQVRHLAGL